MKHNDQVALGCQMYWMPNILVPNIPGGQIFQVPKIPRCLISLVPNIPRGQTSWVPNIPGGQMYQMANILRGLICRCQMCFGAKCQVPSIPMLNVLGAKWVTASIELKIFGFKFKGWNQSYHQPVLKFPHFFCLSAGKNSGNFKTGWS